MEAWESEETRISIPNYLNGLKGSQLSFPFACRCFPPHRITCEARAAGDRDREGAEGRMRRKYQQIFNNIFFFFKKEER